MKVKSESEVAQSCLTLSDPMDCFFWDPYNSNGVLNIVPEVSETVLISFYSFF